MGMSGPSLLIESTDSIINIYHSLPEKHSWTLIIISISIFIVLDAYPVYWVHLPCVKIEVGGVTIAVI